MSIYTRSSKNYARTKEEYLQLFSDLKIHKKDMIERLLSERDSGVKHPGAFLLDSSLITAYEKKSYQYKLIECGDYLCLYNFNQLKNKKDKNLELMENKTKVNIYKWFEDDVVEKSRGDPKLNKIEFKNIIRSKMQMERLVKTNEGMFKTFITLTFADNAVDIKKTNEIFHHWVSNLRKLKKDFAYVAVPEFQDRGAVHYHLLTNLDVKQNPDIIIPQKKFTEKQYIKMSKKQRDSCYDIKYWPHGFVRVDILKDMNVIGYLTKYMTKDIDNRLFGYRRYLYSRNLKQPTTVYLNPFYDKDFYVLLDIINNSNECFTNSYLDPFGNVVDFVELKKVVI